MHGPTALVVRHESVASSRTKEQVAPQTKRDGLYSRHSAHFVAAYPRLAPPVVVFLDNGRWAGNLNTMRTVADAMTKPVIVELSATIQNASATMLDGRSEAAIVVEGGKVCGLVSAEDVARALAESLDPTETPVGAIAGTDPPLARGDEALADVHQRMRAEEHPLAVVIAPDGQPVGLLADHEAST